MCTQVENVSAQSHRSRAPARRVALDVNVRGAPGYTAARTRFPAAPELDGLVPDVWCTLLPTLHFTANPGHR